MREQETKILIVPKVYVIILNWNGWQDTIECLESVFRILYLDFTVVVCDNASADGSIEQIKAWARGEIVVGVRNQDLSFLTAPPIPKPVPFEELSAGRESNDGLCSSARLILIQTGGNLGFAGGNNVGLRYALARQDCDFAWVLNNDTVVAPNALSALVQRMQERPDAGICGSTLLYYNSPQLVQALCGSTFNMWTARGVQIGGGSAREVIPPPEVVERKMGYVVGASMLVTRSFVERIGLMDERYFLYFEEIDWALSGADQFSLAYSVNSIVYHKEGASIGSSSTAAASTLAEFYLARNRLLFTWKHFQYAIPSVCLAVLVSSMRRLIRGNPKNFLAIIRGLLAGMARHRGIESGFQLRSAKDFK